ncbi:methylenetetrahydrofolate--tRNA-(uracil(54)-C(5))-methyltransferase (FADH(2)-oxidizing) TrmFO [Chloracidobacterium sp. MS 40/45]|jgi:methylenetetrahydrofolate--tRNA-(uracil-5-)-methyltransferase|uniref:methylenetetrahydrofolate--tRNA-(uracil(54)- C(5))-methyltransferase (FADH(2)-oxidizing) TrmFO n=1 Tax=Chloracidobacterium aggregatum TaxID=2851959 RepID=UPI001B8C89CE|nr:methylenetetrahydrofolate--tRNA-(uracil(54)-C(5))-methyltransferase (FADH(2)-oxidizing) TrmFO [Chloracidobacterium aggregatum]QUV98965.1 methylenetetrahydrofolate--tRNA-(uracil(54)-C(5))-methyltransferase (FADH(2)-oxidizing) TrmFO [Chloracidobacterium sp. MS 40/45]
MHDNVVTVIGGGLAGCEAAWQCAEQGVPVRLYEMRPVRPTPAHTTDRLAEIVCSNSFKSDEVNTAPHLLKEELRRARSLLIAVAEATRVPAGAALAIDRERFAAEVTARIAAHPRITVIREEVTRIPPDGVTIIATGPLTSDALAAEIQNLAGAEQLYFYDAIAPVVDAETINYEVVFRAARYGKGGDDYLNCPLNKEQYEAFVDALLAAECVAPKAFETDKAQYFEACLPIDVAVRRGRDTLRFGPMKPVGLCDPRTGREPYAAVQLRQENLMADSYSLVGFQNSVKWGAQKALLRMIPGLEQAEFLKFGQVHRNTYVNGPKLLTPTLQVKHEPRLFFAGQISGVEGYVESLATGLVAGRWAAALVQGKPLLPVPRASAIGSLLNYVAHCENNDYQPVNITFALLPPLAEPEARAYRRRPERRARQIALALAAFGEWLMAMEAGKSSSLAGEAA